MRTITFKCVYQNQYYSLRKIRIKADTGETYAVGNLETVTIELEKQQSFQVKLDYHKKTIDLKDYPKDENLFIILTLEYRQTFPGNFADAYLFKNLMRTIAVSSDEFKDYEFQLPTRKIQYKEYGWIDYLKIAMAAITYLFLVAVTIIYDDLNQQNFIFIIGVASIFASIRLLNKRKSITCNHFNFVIQTSAYIPMAILALVGLPGIAQDIGIILSFSVFAISWVGTENKSMQEI